MRKIVYYLLLILMLLLPMLLSASNRGGLEFGYDNVQVQSIDGISYLNFDVMLKGSLDSDRLGTGIALINYNPAAFGHRIRNQNNVIVSKGTLISGNPSSYYNLYIADSIPTRLAITYEYFYPQGYGTLVPSEFQQLLNIKIKIQNYDISAGISFYSTGMNNQQYLDDNATIFSPVISTASITEPIPMAPQISSISSQNAQISIAWEAIPNCSYNVLSASAPDSATWITEAENISNNYWTGSSGYDKRFYIVTASPMRIRK